MKKLNLDTNLLFHRDSQRKMNDRLTKKIIGCAIEVHKALGPGLLESAYQECLLFELKSKGLKVENKIVIELKTVEAFTDVHFAQILTYLKLGNYPLGLLINFHTKLLKNGIKRFINTPQ